MRMVRCYGNVSLMYVVPTEGTASVAGGNVIEVTDRKSVV